MVSQTNANILLIVFIKILGFSTKPNFISKLNLNVGNSCTINMNIVKSHKDVGIDAKDEYSFKLNHCQYAG